MALLALTLFASRVQGESLIQDDLFDSGSGSDGRLPTGLSVSSNSTDGPGAVASVSDVAPALGKHSLCIQRLEPTGNFWIHFDQKVSLQPGSRYYFSCQVKSTAGTPQVGFELFDANGKGLGDTLLQDAILANPNGEFRHNVISLRWCLAEHPDDFNVLGITFTVPDRVSYVRVNLSYNWNSGTAWFSDFNFLPLDRS